MLIDGKFYEATEENYAKIDAMSSISEMDPDNVYPVSVQYPDGALWEVLDGRWMKVNNA